MNDIVVFVNVDFGGGKDGLEGPDVWEESSSVTKGREKKILFICLGEKK